VFYGEQSASDMAGSIKSTFYLYVHGSILCSVTDNRLCVQFFAHCDMIMIMIMMMVILMMIDDAVDSVAGVLA